MEKALRKDGSWLMLWKKPQSCPGFCAPKHHHWLRAKVAKATTFCRGWFSGHSKAVSHCQLPSPQLGQPGQPGNWAGQEQRQLCVLTT